ncbi:N-acetylmuramoyl-L-alanine amidase [Aneurinibacillus sp. REN35]|uniref:N-acetylmuramoyl-L-alanine amidase n=1 Tax=Aneurinibacillus sp. REN35 TaxID=3237286 RepID=UPI003528B468
MCARVSLIYHPNEAAEVKIGPRPSEATGTARLKPRTDGANAWGADHLLLFHINAGGATGYETHVYEKCSAELLRVAQIIHAEVAGVFKAQGLPDRGIKKTNLHMTRESKMPAALLEFGFIDNGKDAALLKDQVFLQKVAEAAARGVAKAYRLKRKVGVEKPTAPQPQLKEEPKMKVDDANKIIRVLQDKWNVVT